MQVIQNGYALVIHNSKYNGQEFVSNMSSMLVIQFFERFGCKTDLCGDFTAEVMCHY